MEVEQNPDVRIFMSYFIGVQGVQSGPFSEAVIREKIARGELPADALCWVEGWSDWLRVSAVFPATAAPLPPPMPVEGVRTAPPAASPAYQGPVVTSGLAITSLVTGVFGLVFFLPAIAAVICGHIACSKIKHSAGRIAGRGMAITGLVLGYLIIALMPIGLMAAMAIPAFQKVRSASQEKAIQLNLRMIDAAAGQYMLENGTTSARYADLVGPEELKYIAVLTPVAGEDYTRLVILSTDKEISVTMEGGRVITLERNYVSDKPSF